MTQDRGRWVADVLAGLDAYPAYYVHMAPANSRGPLAADLAAPRPADRSAVADRITAGDWVVDLRARAAYADAHVAGTVNIGLDGQFSTYLGWLVPYGASLTLLGDTVEQVAEAQRQLVRIGFDRFDGAATGTPSQWTDRALASLRRAAFTDLAAARDHRDVTVLDVRLAGEFATSHVEGALNLPLHELAEHLDDIAAGEVWVHCASGYRASVAASILATRGIPAVAVDGSFDEQAAPAGLPPTDGAVETTSLGALGGDGSILAVPVLVYALGESASQATTGSLVVVGTTALIGAVVVHVPEPVLLASLAVLMLAVGAVMTVRQPRGRGAEPSAPADADDPILTFWPVFSCRCPRAAGGCGRHRGRAAHRLPRRRWRLPRRPRPAAGPEPTHAVRGRDLAGGHRDHERRRAVRARRLRGAPGLGVVVLLTAASVAGALIGARVAARTDTRRLAAVFTVLVLAVAVYTARALPALA